MGIYAQSNTWQCGPFALKHALLAHGVFAHEDDIARLAGSSEARGTDERGLARAARAYGARLGLDRHTDPDAARRLLVDHLRGGVPVLLCVDQWEHWVAAVAAEADDFVLFDSYSHYRNPVQIEPWERLAARLAYRERRLHGMWTRTLYDLHPLMIERAPRVRLALTPARAQDLLTEANGLSRVWDEYARHVLPFAAPRGAQLELGLPLAAFIAGRRGEILAAAGVNGGPERRAAEQAVDGLVFAARLYDATLRPELEPDAVPRLGQAVGQLAGPTPTR